LSERVGYIKLFERRVYQEQLAKYEKRTPSAGENRKVVTTSS
jgi:hypothetical protein